jgi:hypothetical protein
MSTTEDPEEEILSDLYIDLVQKLSDIGIKIPISSYEKLHKILKLYLYRARYEGDRTMKSAILATLLLAIAGCAAQQQPTSSDTIKQIVIDCSKAGLKQGIDELAPVLKAIIDGTAVEWRKMLSGIAKELGTDAVACTLARLAPPLGATGTTSAKAAGASPQGQARARSFMADQGWVTQGTQ